MLLFVLALAAQPPVLRGEEGVGPSMNAVVDQSVQAPPGPPPPTSQSAPPKVKAQIKPQAKPKPKPRPKPDPAAAHAATLKAAAKPTEAPAPQAAPQAAAPGAAPSPEPTAQPPASTHEGEIISTAPPLIEGDRSEHPAGAPKDDYGVVAWCQGALAGHMGLYPIVQPAIAAMHSKGAAPADAQEDARLDAEQMEAGRDYLDLYARARAAADARDDGARKDLGDAARKAGDAMWAGVRGAEPQTRMWAWLSWELPARCETAARRLLSGQSQ
jgi:hypothetical protein